MRISIAHNRPGSTAVLHITNDGEAISHYWYLERTISSLNIYINRGCRLANILASNDFIAWNIDTHEDVDPDKIIKFLKVFT